MMLAKGIEVILLLVQPSYSSVQYLCINRLVNCLPPKLIITYYITFFGTLLFIV